MISAGWRYRPSTRRDGTGCTCATVSTFSQAATRQAPASPRFWSASSASQGTVGPAGRFSNHDVVRHTTRWSLSPEAHRTYLAVLLSLRGSVCLYQGEELGLNEADIAFEDLHDPYGIRFWPAFKGRDGCRTPMVWHANRQHGGFSEAKPWLPFAEEHASRAVDAQESDPDSMLNFYRRMIAYRASRPELVKGTFDVVEADEGFLSAIRTRGRKRLFTAFNLSGQAREVVLPAGEWKTDHDAPFDAGDGTILPPWQATFKEAS